MSRTVLINGKLVPEPRRSVRLVSFIAHRERVLQYDSLTDMLRELPLGPFRSWETTFACRHVVRLDDEPGWGMECPVCAGEIARDDVRVLAAASRP
jgi:hypothetical protein